jgi:hypothetical protein
LGGQNTRKTNPVTAHAESDAQFEATHARREWVRWKYVASRFAALKSAGIPCRYGVYVIRGPVLIPRVRGVSNVIYVGQSGGGARRGRQGIGPGNGGPGRLFNTRGPDQVVRERIEALFQGQRFTLECTFNDSDDPKAFEHELLDAYFADHCELPPANHSGAR